MGTEGPTPVWACQQVANGQENSVVTVHMSDKGVKPLCSASSHLNLSSTGERKKNRQGHGITILQMESGGPLGLQILYMDAHHDELHLLNPSAEISKSQDLKIWP